MRQTAFDVIAGLFCIGAGIYLLSSNTQAENSVFDVLMHGIGAYVIGKGIFVMRAGWLAVKQGQVFDDLLQFAAAEHQRSTGRAGTQQ
jgi:hypothetical protein